jgi:hypothetical protein
MRRLLLIGVAISLSGLMLTFMTSGILFAGSSP